jgi:hypothetical protein
MLNALRLWALALAPDWRLLSLLLVVVWLSWKVCVAQYGCAYTPASVCSLRAPTRSPACALPARCAARWCVPATSGAGQPRRRG